MQPKQLSEVVPQTPQPASQASNSAQDGEACDRKNNLIFVAPSISIVILVLFAVFAVGDINSEGPYSGLTALAYSFIVGPVLAILSFFSLALHYKEAKHKKIGLIVNIAMLGIGLSPLSLPIVFGVRSSIAQQEYEAKARVGVCVKKDSSWSCGDMFIYPDTSNKDECQKIGGTVLVAAENKTEFRQAYKSDATYANRAWVCVESTK
jgi:hypothetical protein